MAVKAGINGFGRIGRKSSAHRTRARGHRLGRRQRHHGHQDARPPPQVRLDPRSVPRDRGGTGDGLMVDGKELKVFAERDPAALPWADVGADVVVESTGLFTDRDDSAHRGGTVRWSRRGVSFEAVLHAILQAHWRVDGRDAVRRGGDRLAPRSLPRVRSRREYRRRSALRPGRFEGRRRRGPALPASCTAYCHGKDGGPSRAPKLRGSKLERSYVYARISKGSPNGMPGFEATMPRENIWKLVAYVLSLSNAEDK